MSQPIEIADFPQTDYEPLIDYEGWRVAVLAYCENTTIDKIKTMQKHDETDEVFVLVRGKCALITGGNAEEPGQPEFTSLQPHKAYTIKKGFWHEHVLDEEGIVLIIENSNTCDDNSPRVKLSAEQCKALKDKYSVEKILK